MTDTNEQAISAQIKADAAARRDELLDRKAAKSEGAARRANMEAARAQSAEIMETLKGQGALTSVQAMVGATPAGDANDITTIAESAGRQQMSRRSKQARAQNGKAAVERNRPATVGPRDDAEELRQAGINAIRGLQGHDVDDEPEPEPETKAKPAPRGEAQASASEDLAARLRGEEPLPKGGPPQPLKDEHREALLALQVPKELVAAWAEKDPDGLARFAETQYEARRKREDAFTSRDRLIAAQNDRLKALEQAVGLVGEPTPPVRGGAEPGAAGEALRAALGEDGASSAAAASTPDVRALIEAEVRKAAAPLLERHAAEEKQRLLSQLHAARTDLGKSWPGLLDDTTFTERVAPKFLELYSAGVSGRDVRSLMELAAFAGLGGATRASDVVDPTPSRNEPGTRAGRAPQVAKLSPREAGLKAINELLRSGNVEGSVEYANELGRAVRAR